MLFQKLNKKSEKIRNIKNALKERTEKLKDLKTQMNGKHLEEEYSFEEEDFNDEDEEDF